MIKARIAVVILSYNGCRDAMSCIEALLTPTKRSFDVILVDNASTDGTADAVRAAFPDVTLVRLLENRGFAGGINAGITRALDDGAELICLLNDDTTVRPSVIASLAETAIMFDPCLVHPAIDYADPSDGTQLDPARSRSTNARRLDGTDGIFELDFAYGACMMVPSSIFRRVGLFDERFFLQMEETDFYTRARRIGVRSLCDVRVRIIHAESRTFGGRLTPEKTYYIVRNTLLHTEKHHLKPGELGPSIKSLYWTISRTATRDAGSQRANPLGWLVSRDPHLVAVRAGVRDYLLRRFGRIGETTLKAIRV